MDDLHIGERVAFRDRVYFVRGVSPMSVVPCWVHLEDAETGEEVEADADDLEVDARLDGRSENGLRSIS